jgi:CubicO group peptidase (beta-lactamase class C family)
VLVSAAIEAATKEPLSTFMTAQVFKPLGMTGTTFESSAEPSVRGATTLMNDDAAAEIQEIGGSASKSYGVDTGGTRFFVACSNA